MNLIHDLLIKGILGGIGGSAVKAIILVVEAIAKPKYLVGLALHIIEAAVAKTPGKTDDNVVAMVKDILVKEKIIDAK